METDVDIISNWKKMENNEIKILLAAPRGFCAGVVRAIDIVEKALKKYGSPVYVRHEIVHNKHVVDNLKKKGAIFVEELIEIKDLTRPVIFSAHGVPKNIPEEAKNKKIFYVDATCPLVTKVHREAERYYQSGYKIILIGHKGHPEVIGTMGQLPEGKIVLVENIDDANSLKIEGPVAYVTQTTLSVDDTQDIIGVLNKKFPNLKGPIKEDICYATTNRQFAVKQIAPLCEMFFVIGSENSSNSKRLVEVAKKSGCEKSKLISFDTELPLSEIAKCSKIGLTSGASAPEKLVQDFIKKIESFAKVKIEEVEIIKENTTFKLPSSLN
jgi:4-hydroxy-3-methylbut-2-en-1-yl diphosphate reductase